MTARKTQNSGLLTHSMPRRGFLNGLGALAGWGAVAGQFPSVTAAEAAIPAGAVQFHPAIEPLVRLLEDTPREKVLEAVVSKLRAGLAYRDLVAALFLAGIRNVQPRPVGFKFHAVLVIHSAHQASVASPESERLLPIFWAIEQFKRSQEADVREGDWTMRPPASGLPTPEKAREAFIAAMERWDEGAADAAVTVLARNAPVHELFHLFARLGARDFREIGHKEIYVAASFRLLELIGWRHAEPVLRSLTYALLDRLGDKNPAEADLPADRPFRRNVENAARFRGGWQFGTESDETTQELLGMFREASAAEVGEAVSKWINAGVAPQSIWDAVSLGATELLMRNPGILSLHATTFTNAARHSFRHAADDMTRRLLLLQAASFVPLFRGARGKAGVNIDEMASPASPAEGGLDEVFEDISSDRMRAATKLYGWLAAGNDPEAFARAGRRLIFLKGTDSHDYKFSSAVLEDYHLVSPRWRNQFLAGSVFNWRGSQHPDSGLAARIPTI